MLLYINNDLGLLTHLTLDKMAAILQTIFSDAFSWMKSFVFWLKFLWCLFLMIQLTIIQYWLLGAEQATSHYLNQGWPSSRTDICGTQERWVNEQLGNLVTMFLAVYLWNDTQPSEVILLIDLHVSWSSAWSAHVLYFLSAIESSTYFTSDVMYRLDTILGKPTQEVVEKCVPVGS